MLLELTFWKFLSLFDYLFIEESAVNNGNILIVDGI